MNMSLTEWSSLVEVGCPRIDAQHKELFALAAVFAGNGDHVRVMKSIVSLGDHVKVHFLEEEHLMEANGFPGLAAHRRQHDKCREMLVELLSRARHMTLDQVGVELKRLIDWLYHHIMTADLEYAPHMTPVFRRFCGIDRANGQCGRECLAPAAAAPTAPAGA